MVRVLIVGGIRLFREGVAQLLSRDPSLSVVGVESDGIEPLARIAELRPDVVLIDMATGNSYRVARDLHAGDPSIRILALGIGDSEEQVLACAEAGASGYLAREGSIEELVSAITSVCNNRLLCSPRMAATLIRHVGTLAAARREAAPEPSRLTRREREIADLLQQDLSNKEIATRLGIEVATVKNHVHNLLNKLQIRRRSETRSVIASRSFHGPLTGHRRPSGTRDIRS